MGDNRAGTGGFDLVCAGAGKKKYNAQQGGKSETDF